MSDVFAETDVTVVVSVEPVEVPVVTAAAVGPAGPPGLGGDANLKVDKNSVLAATDQLLASKLPAGAQPSFKITGDGKIAWGGGFGGAVAPDTFLHRGPSSGQLQTDGSFIANVIVTQWTGPAQIQITILDGNKPMIAMGPAADAKIYRSAASEITISFSIGDRALVLGAPDSAGVGFRAVRVAN